MKMDFDTSWNIDKYRTNFESDEHWDLKKEFMEAHKSKFPEDRLICLSQIFINVQLLRCRYPDTVMKQISILGKRVGHHYKANQKKLLQRTFVEASDAASNKVKGLKGNYSEVSSEAKVATKLSNETISSSEAKCPTKSSNGTVSLSSQMELQNKYILALKGAQKDSSTLLSNTPRLMAARKKIKKDNNNNTEEKKKPDEKLQVPVSQSAANFFSRFLVVRNNSETVESSTSILKRSFQMCKMELAVNYKVTSKNNFGSICSLSVGSGHYKGLFLGKAKGSDNVVAKRKAARKALLLLLKKCYTIKLLKREESNKKICVEDMSNRTSTEGGNPGQALAEMVSHYNVWSKMFRLMGWASGVLGKKGGGITDPNIITPFISRQDLGLGEDGEVVTKQFKANVGARLREFKRRQDTSDLVFSTELSPAQTKYIVLRSDRIGKGRLKIASYRQYCSRYLMASYNHSITDLAENIISQGRKTDKYELFKPGTLTIKNLRIQKHMDTKKTTRGNNS